MLDSLRLARCRILYVSSASVAPFRIVFETAEGERMGIVAYAFFANAKATKNRPDDEHRFQVKYGAKEIHEQEIWQDPYGLYTTLFLGIDPDLGVFVGADPVLHNPTRFFISIEFKRQHVGAILQNGWHVWERERRSAADEPVEVLVGGTHHSFLDYVRFERDAVGEDQGHRQLLAERVLVGSQRSRQVPSEQTIEITGARLHDLAQEFELAENEVLDLIAGARRLKMAVRGWVAELHLVRQLQSVAGVSDCERIEADGGPDVRLRYLGSRLLTVECKNVLRNRAADGTPRMDFQRTRRGSDPCSRYYEPREFDVVAACLHAVTSRWEFQYALPGHLDPHRTCEGRLSNRVLVDGRWQSPVEYVLASALR